MLLTLDKLWKFLSPIYSERRIDDTATANYMYLSVTIYEGPTLETLDFTIRIGSTPTFLHFNLYLYSAYAAHYAKTLRLYQ